MRILLLLIGAQAGACLSAHGRNILYISANTSWKEGTGWHGVLAHRSWVLPKKGLLWYCHPSLLRCQILQRPSASLFFVLGSPLVLLAAGSFFGDPLLITALRGSSLSKPGRTRNALASTYVTAVFVLHPCCKARLSAFIMGAYRLASGKPCAWVSSTTARGCRRFARPARHNGF